MYELYLMVMSAKIVTSIVEAASPRNTLQRHTVDHQPSEEERLVGYRTSWQQKRQQRSQDRISARIETVNRSVRNVRIALLLVTVLIFAFAIVSCVVCDPSATTSIYNAVTLVTFSFTGVCCLAMLIVLAYTLKKQFD